MLATLYPLYPQDQECRQNGRPLVKYDAMLIYATDEVYQKGHPLQGQPLPESERSDVFAAHLRERMESAGLQVLKAVSIFEVNLWDALK